MQESKETIHYGEFLDFIEATVYSIHLDNINKLIRDAFSKLRTETIYLPNEWKIEYRCPTALQNLLKSYYKSIGYTVGCETLNISDSGMSRLTIYL